MTLRAPLLTILMAASGILPARADGFDAGGAKSRIESAGYSKVDSVHQGNLGDWMAEAEKDGHHVLVVLHADGRIDLRQQVEVAPVQVEPVPVPAAGKP